MKDDQNRDRKEEHKQNVSAAMAKASTPEARLKVLLQGVVDAQRSKFARLAVDVEAECAFMEKNIADMVAGVMHGVPKQ